jgi:hypothetical protein
MSQQKIRESEMEILCSDLKKQLEEMKKDSGVKTMKMEKNIKYLEGLLKEAVSEEGNSNEIIGKLQKKIEEQEKHIKIQSSQISELKQAKRICCKHFNQQPKQ